MWQDIKGILFLAGVVGLIIFFLLNKHKLEAKPNQALPKTPNPNPNPNPTQNPEQNENEIATLLDEIKGLNAKPDDDAKDGGEALFNRAMIYMQKGNQAQINGNPAMGTLYATTAAKLLDRARRAQNPRPEPKGEIVQVRIKLNPITGRKNIMELKGNDDGKRDGETAKMG